MNVFVPLDELTARPRPRPDAATAPYLLINPPMTDPTAPYHSIPYLVGAARAAGHDVYRCLDANLDALEHLAHPDRFGATLDRARQLRERVGTALRAPGTAPVSRRDEIRYRLALAAEGLTATSAQSAIAVFRDPELFYHQETYSQAVAVVNRWLDLISMDMPVGALDGFSLRGKAEANLCSTADLADPAVIESFGRPFADYITGPFSDALREQPWGLVGLSVNYTSQLPMALRMARRVRELLPDTVIVFGGTEVGDTVKYTADKDAIWRVFRDADLIVPGEGETALIAILDAVRDGKPFDGLRGVMTRSAPDCAIAYENVGALPSPAFDVWDWERYWSPEPVVLYSPTRGCYWNKCTFCDYGLNTDRPTSPSRERPTESVLQDLEAARKHGRVLYFAVDAMSPRYLRKLAAALADSGTDFKWAAELRLERTFPERGVGALLADSGCVAISFGYESGTQRVLDLIDKGVRIADVPGVLGELARNGIAAQMMGFTGFPTETAAEARATYEFLHEHDGLWTTAGIGVFSLTPGSIVAKKPERFDIELLPLSASDDIHRYVPWREVESGVEHWPDAADPRIPADHLAWAQRLKFDRPFVGGIDAAHSLLYFARFGPGLLPPGAEREQPRVRLVEEPAVPVPFASYDELTSVDDLIGEMARRSRENTDTTSTAFAGWLAEPGNARSGSSGVLVLTQGKRVELPPGADCFSDTPLSRAVRIMVAAQARG